MRKSNVYKGYTDAFGDRRVLVNGNDSLDPCLNIYSHSPTGFNWGYAGSGPAQLALAIMVNEFGADLRQHPRHYQDFKRDFLQAAGNSFEFTSSDIRTWISGGTNEQ